MDWASFGLIVGLPLLRSIFGWAQNALEDGVIEFFEWRKLVTTIVKLGVPGALLFWGLELPVEIAASLPVIVDYILVEIRKLVIKTKA